MGIPNVGKKTAGDLARAFGSLTAIREATQEELLAIPDIGEIVASSIVTYFADEKIKENIDELLALGIKPLQMENEILDNPFKDKTVVVTGTLSSYTRTEIEKLLTDLGAKVSSSVSKQTDYLIYGDKAGSKLSKAKAIKEANPDSSLEIIDEDTLNGLIQAKIT